MKRALLIVLFVVGYIGTFALGWHADQRIAILTAAEYNELLMAKAALQSVMNNPAQICRKDFL